MPEKYIGRCITIIYLDQSGRFTQRRIRVDSIADGYVRAFDLEKRAPRVFLLHNILAIDAAGREAG